MPLPLLPGGLPVSFDSAKDIKNITLFRAEEFLDGSSDFDDAVDDIFIEVWRDLTTRHPWLCLIRDAPGSFLTTAPILTLTISVPQFGAPVTATLSAPVAVGLAGRKVTVQGGNYAMRITAHNPASDQITLDAAPEVLGPGTPVTIYQDEYELNAELGCFVDGLWTPDSSDPIPLWSEERVKEIYGTAIVSGYPPDAFARLTKTKIRLSSYPTQVKRIEYPYSFEPEPPPADSAEALVLSKYLRPALAAGTLAILYKLKLDRRFQITAQSYERRIQRGIEYETRMRTAVLGRTSGRVAASVWGE